MTTRFIAPDTTSPLDPYQFALRASDLRIPAGDLPFYGEDSELVRQTSQHGVYLDVRIVTAQFPMDQKIGFRRESSTWRDLLVACYDAHQCYDGWQDGDVLAVNVMLPLGGAQVVEFARVHSFHIVPLTSPTLPTTDDFRKHLPLVLMPPQATTPSEVAR